MDNKINIIKQQLNEIIEELPIEAGFQAFKIYKIVDELDNKSLLEAKAKVKLIEFLDEILLSIPNEGGNAAIKLNKIIESIYELN
jgi:hypothetical protein